MIGKVLRGAGQRHGARACFALCVSSSLGVAILRAAPAAAQSPPYFNAGLRWIGIARPCTAPADWTAEPLFLGHQLPPALSNYCLYRWTPATRDTTPTPAQVHGLFSVSQAQEMTEDVPVVFPSAPFSAEEVAVFAGLRGALRDQVGDSSLLPAMPASPRTRVVVIDSAPDATHGHIQPGMSRHGDTLAHLIEDLVCTHPGGGGNRACAAEITTELALPWIARGVPGPSGGYIGTLADVARAIERAVSTWQSDRQTAPSSTPPRLLLNLSLGWEDTPGIADCAMDPAKLVAPPARAVQAILQQAVAQGALVIAAAGNDSGGPAPRTGLICPGRYQALPQDANPSQSLVVAASGVDYQDRALATARPHGITAITALGLGGVAWQPSDPVPPQLVGSSVSAAVVSAVSALVWAYKPGWTTGQVIAAVYSGGVEVGAADDCPLPLRPCSAHRASVCGALLAAGAAPGCAPPEPRPWSSPDLSAQIAALAAAYASVPPGVAAPVPPSAIPRYLAPSVQVAPSVFPMPISVTCPTCAVAPTPAAASLVIPALGQDLRDAVLVVTLADDSVQSLGLGSLLVASPSYVFPLPAGWLIQSAYLTGFDGLHQYSITEQIVVQQ